MLLVQLYESGSSSRSHDALALNSSWAPLLTTVPLSGSSQTMNGGWFASRIEHNTSRSQFRECGPVVLLVLSYSQPAHRSVIALAPVDSNRWPMNGPSTASPDCGSVMLRSDSYCEKERLTNALGSPCPFWLTAQRWTYCMWSTVELLGIVDGCRGCVEIRRRCVFGPMLTAPEAEVEPVRLTSLSMMLTVPVQSACRSRFQDSSSGIEASVRQS